jgi:hypothetical protein
LAEELSGQVEGDMLIDEIEWAAYNGRVEKWLRWPRGIVPYWINETFFSKRDTRAAFAITLNAFCATFRRS